MTGFPEQRALKKGALLLGLLAVALGASIMAGWHMGLRDWVQWSADIVPMQYNTALAVALCGIALLLDGMPRWRLVSMGVAGLVMAFSIVTGLQYITGHDYGVDALLMDPHRMDQVKTIYPGRMAPNTTVCFILMMAAILCRHVLKVREVGLSAAVMLSLTVLAFALTALAGYLFSIEAAYGWWSLSNMSPQTALALFLIAAGFFFSYFSEGLINISDSWKNMRVPLIVAIVGIALTLVVAQALLDQGQKRTQTQARAGAIQVAHILEEVFRVRTKELASLWSRQESGDVWRVNAETFLRNNESYYSFVLLDADYKPVTVATRAGFTAPWDRVAFDPVSFERARQAERAYIWHVPELGEGKILIGQPLGDGKSVVGLYDLQKNMNRVFGSGSINYQYKILDDQGLRASNFLPGQKYLWDVDHEETIEAGGHEFRIEVHINASQYAGGGLIFIIFISGFCISVLFASATYKTKRIEEIASVLKKSEERYAVAVDGSEVALWDWDLVTMTVEWAGQAWKMFGVATNAQVPYDNTGIRSLIHPEDNEKLDATIYSELEKGDAFVAEFRLKQPDGKYRWVQSRGKAVMRRDHAPTRIAGIFTDITPLKKTEEQLRRMNEELEQFAYIASHDLKAPLRGIDNLAKWISEDLDDVLTEDARDKMKLLRGRVSRLEMLLEDILQYSRAGRIVDEPVPVDTGEMVARIVESINLPPGFSVTVDDVMPVVQSSYTPLEQVFMNLINNACKHHDRAEGKITVSAVDRGFYYEFAVSDDGPGIPAEFQERVFRMFQTLKPRDEKESSGLGLSIVKKLIEWQGGRVWIVSTAGQRGASFHFMWPKKFEVEERNKNAA